MIRYRFVSEVNYRSVHRVIDNISRCTLSSRPYIHPYSNIGSSFREINQIEQLHNSHANYCLLVELPRAISESLRLHAEYFSPVQKSFSVGLAAALFRVFCLLQPKHGLMSPENTRDRRTCYIIAVEGSSKEVRMRSRLWPHPNQRQPRAASLAYRCSLKSSVT